MSQEFEGVKLVKAQGSLNRDGVNTDGHIAIVIQTQTLPAGVADNAINETFELADAVALGIDASFDANNNILAYHHIEEFYRLAPEGKLFVILTSSTTAATFFALPVVTQIFKTIDSVKKIGFVYNNNVTDLDLDAELLATQKFVDDMAAEHYLIDGVYLEGRNIGTAGTDNRLLDASNCHVVIAQDPDIASIDAAYANYAAVGSALGMRAVRTTKENLGSTDVINKPDSAKGDLVYSLTDETTGRWLSAALSDGTSFDSLTATQKDNLTLKAYIYAGSYSGFAGLFFNAEPSCVAISSDYAHGENNGIWNKAARAIRLALLPKVKSSVKVDTATGNIRNTSAKYLETIAEKPLLTMLANDEISDASVQIPTNQSPSDQSPLKVNASVTKDRIIHLFEVTLALK